MTPDELRKDPMAPFLTKLIEAVLVARVKHPTGTDRTKAFVALVSEVGEVADTLTDNEPEERVFAECIDVAVTALRLAVDYRPSPTRRRTSIALAPQLETIAIDLVNAMDWSVTTPSECTCRCGEVFVSKARFVPDAGHPEGEAPKGTLRPPRPDLVSLHPCPACDSHRPSRASSVG